jgi:hypothetical protein
MRRDPEAEQRRAALEQLRSLDWPGLGNTINSYIGAAPPRRRFRYSGAFCYGHFINQGGAVAIGHIDAAAYAALLRKSKRRAPIVATPCLSQRSLHSSSTCCRVMSRSNKLGATALS